jgi:hypothetical protein
MALHTRIATFGARLKKIKLFVIVIGCFLCQGFVIDSPLTQAAKEEPLPTGKILVQWQKIDAGLESTNMGYMKNYAHVNNAALRKVNNYNSILAFNRKDSSVAPIQIIDLKCQEWPQLQTKYQSFSQSISMISCQGKIVENRQKGKWSMVLWGMDTMGNILLIFTRSPYTIRQFSEILLSLPLSIKNAMYLEASLFLSASGKEIEKMGSYETGFREDDNNKDFFSLPNVIGIVKK